MPRDRQNALLKKAREDVAAYELLSNSEAISDETLGFHAQQAVEKSLKHVLGRKKISYPKTHDLTELIRLLDSGKITRPFQDEEIELLTPYATTLRYEDETDLPLDRHAILKLIKVILAWAERAGSSL